MLRLRPSLSKLVAPNQSTFKLGRWIAKNEVVVQEMLHTFILCQEVLFRLIDRELMNGNFSGIKMNRGGPEISHVMYADDIMLFSKASSKEVEA